MFFHLCCLSPTLTFLRQTLLYACNIVADADAVITKIQTLTLALKLAAN